MTIQSFNPAGTESSSAFQIKISSVFKIIVSQAEGNEIYEQWDIIDILGSYNISFDDMLGNSNNTQHRSDWIMTEQYFMSAVPEGDDN